MTLVEQLNVITSLLEKVQDPIIKTRFLQILNKNPDLNWFLSKLENKENIIIDCYTHAPLTNAEIERSFSQYRLINNDYRQSLKPETIFAILIFKFNQ